jgi:hypothetical protein
MSAAMTMITSSRTGKNRSFSWRAGSAEARADAGVLSLMLGAESVAGCRAAAAAGVAAV